MNKILDHRFTQIVFTIMVIGFVLLIVHPPEISAAKKGVEFAGHLMLGLLGLGLFFLFFNQRRLMVTSFAGSALLAFFLKTASNSNLVLPVQNSQPKISIAHVNLSSIEGDFDDVFNIIDELDLDVISLQEATPLVSSMIDNKLRKRYPYKESMVRIDPFGKVIYSKYPVTSPSTFVLDDNPTLSVVIQLNSNPIKIISPYVIPPFNKVSGANTTQQFDLIANKVNEEEMPTIVLGDFNMVYYSPEIINFRNKAMLGNSRRNASLSAPNEYDHIFYSSQKLECVFFDALKNMQQNHLGIIGTYQLKLYN